MDTRQRADPQNINHWIKSSTIFSQMEKPFLSIINLGMWARAGTGQRQDQRLLQVQQSLIKGTKKWILEQKIQTRWAYSNLFQLT